MEWLKGKKTNIIAILIGLQALIGLLAGDMTFAQFFGSPEFTQLLAAFGMGAMRAGISK